MKIFWKQIALVSLAFERVRLYVLSFTCLEITRGGMQEEAVQASGQAPVLSQVEKKSGKVCSHLARLDPDQGHGMCSRSISPSTVHSQHP